MLRKNYFIFLTALALFFTSSVMIFAQGSTLRGKVQIKKADGTVAPVEGATIDFYRTDADGKLASTKTDAKGAFTSEEAPTSQTFAVVVSAPNIKPQVATDVKSGKSIVIDVSAGGGEIPTEAEVREALAASAPESEAGKKARAEREKKAAEIAARNEKNKNINQITNQANTEGKAAFDAKNYDVAIVKYTEGFNADPEFVGTASVFLNNRGTALKMRGLESYRKATTDTANKASLMESAKKDFQESVNDFQKSLVLLKGANVTDPKLQKEYEAAKKTALTGVIDTRRLMVGTRADMTQNKEAVAAVEEYAAIETDPAAKTKTMISLADTLRSAGDSENAVPIYRKILETTPDNVDVMGGLGLSLVNVASGTNPPDKAMMQEALNLLDRFVQSAPDTHPLKADVKGVSDYLKNTEKLTPQKVGKPAPAKKKT